MAAMYTSDEHPASVALAADAKKLPDLGLRVSGFRGCT